jgi:hypothetical protein
MHRSIIKSAIAGADRRHLFGDRAYPRPRHGAPGEEVQIYLCPYFTLHASGTVPVLASPLIICEFAGTLPGH